MDRIEQQLASVDELSHSFRPEDLEEAEQRVAELHRKIREGIARVKGEISKGKALLVARRKTHKELQKHIQLAERVKVILERLKKKQARAVEEEKAETRKLKADEDELKEKKGQLHDEVAQIHNLERLKMVQEAVQHSRVSTASGSMFFSA